MRDKDIVNTLKHTGSKQQELLSLMFDSKMQGSSVENIANLVVDILNNLTKCFDYCANDIYDKYIYSYLEQKDKGKVKAYFPFYKYQLTNKKNPLNLLFTLRELFIISYLRLRKDPRIMNLLQIQQFPILLQGRLGV